MRSTSAKPAYLTILLQAVFAIILALVYGLLVSWQAAVSALLGGIVTAVPALIFARFAFASHGARAAYKILRQFYIGEALKFISMAVLFAAILLCIHVEGGPFIITFVMTQLLALIAPRWFNFRTAEVV